MVSERDRLYWCLVRGIHDSGRRNIARQAVVNGDETEIAYWLGQIENAWTIERRSRVVRALRVLLSISDT